MRDLIAIIVALACSAVAAGIIHWGEDRRAREKCRVCRRRRHFCGAGKRRPIDRREQLAAELPPVDRPEPIVTRVTPPAAMAPIEARGPRRRKHR